MSLHPCLRIEMAVVIVTGNSEYTPAGSSEISYFVTSLKEALDNLGTKDIILSVVDNKGVGFWLRKFAETYQYPIIVFPDSWTLSRFVADSAAVAIIALPGPEAIVLAAGEILNVPVIHIKRPT